MSKFQNEIKRLRQSRNWTQLQMADSLGISRSSVGMYEQGKREPDFETLERIADIFNVSMSVLIEDPMEADVLDQNELDLVRIYRSGSSDLQTRLLAYARKLKELTDMEEGK